MLELKVIVGSTRAGRFSELLVPWITKTVETYGEFNLEVIDLREYQMPFFDAAVSPAYIENGDYGHGVVNTFAQKIATADAVVMITPEYNHGYSAVLKNAIDSVYREWNNKPLGIVSYGSAGGARAVEQLRQVAIELQMAPIRNGVHVMAPWLLTENDGSLKAGVLDSYTASLESQLAQLHWWANALSVARKAT
jgi:NAD(P)H-dependent FMN reductase